LAGVSFNQVLRLPAGESVAVQAVVETLERAGERRTRIRCYARSGPGRGWIEHATVAAASTGPPARSRRVDLNAMARGLVEQDVDALYEGLRRRALEHGPGLRGVRRLVRRGPEAIAWIDLGPAATDADAYLFDPAILDACLHPVVVFLDDDQLWLPIAIDRVTVHARLTAPVVCQATWRHDSATADLNLRTTRGSLLATIEGLRLHPVGASLTTPAPVRIRRAATTTRTRRRSTPTGQRPASARETVTAQLLDKLAELLHLPAADREALRPTFDTVPLNTLGVDSLTTVQLRNWLLSDLAVEVTPDVLLGGATGGAVVDLVCEQLALRQVIAGDETPDDGASLEVIRL
jgi:hypothetical protein